jgi:TDG/mug DNA glycosylase family protein
MPQRKPTRAELQRAHNAAVGDLIVPDLRALFCGINPGLYSGATGLHFARPGNRFWPALHLAGFTDRPLVAADEHELLARGYGITKLVERATATAAELRPEELVAGGRQLIATLERYRPRAVAILGMGAYRTAFGQPRATIGAQPDLLEGVLTWLLPNPSGLNAHYSLEELGALFRAFRLAVDARADQHGAYTEA